MPVSEIRVRGLRELQLACKLSESELGSILRVKLREAAEPVKADAEVLGPQRIRNLGPRWSHMRTGITLRTVYVAPAARRRQGSPRPNLAGLLMQVLAAAFERTSALVEAKLQEVIDEIVTRHW